MSVIVFAGPSIKREQINQILPNADIRPPAKQGDVYLATYDRPQIIVLIDGFFESVPAVWHKEILYAMSIGIHVYGCSSMGALRAAELHPFGMIGVGEIFEQFANNTLEDDDEVALTHGPHELNYMPISRAMVDLTYDLTRAVAQNLLTRAQADNIQQQLKTLWYPNRSHTALYEIAEKILTSSQLKQLQTFFEQENISLKEQDASKLLNKIAAVNLSQLPAKTVSFNFCQNDAWQTLTNDVSSHFQPPKAPNLPTKIDKKEADIIQTDDAIFTSKLRARALAHAEELKLDARPWIQIAFEKVARTWGCTDENGDILFEIMAAKMQTLSLDTEQFDQWINREALLIAYANQIDITESHLLDQQLLHR